MAEKPVNYTEEMVNAMIEAYTKEPTRDTVNALAQQFDKSEPSIIGKLSNLGIYQTPARTTKNGMPIIRKEELVSLIQDGTGLDLPSLGKATKADLQRLADFFTN